MDWSYKFIADYFSNCIWHTKWTSVLFSYGFANETCPSIPHAKAKTSHLGLNLLYSDSANFWKKICHVFIYQISNLKKEKLLKLLQIHFLDTCA